MFHFSMNNFENPVFFGDAWNMKEISEENIHIFSFIGDVVLDPFTGSGTALKVAKEWGRKYVGYEVVKSCSKIIEKITSSRGI